MRHSDGREEPSLTISLMESRTPMPRRRTRPRMRVTVAGAASIEFLDETGKTVRTVTAQELAQKDNAHSPAVAHSRHATRAAAGGRLTDLRDICAMVDRGHQPVQGSLRIGFDGDRKSHAPDAPTETPLLSIVGSGVAAVHTDHLGIDPGAILAKQEGDRASDVRRLSQALQGRQLRQ